MRRLTFFRSVFFSSLILTAVITLSVATARADEVTIIGFTNGCFGASCNPFFVGVPAAPPVTLLGLTFRSSGFSGVSSGGSLALSDAPSLANPFQNNLGVITLDGTSAIYDGQTFKLRISFQSPPSDGNSTFVVSALLTGTVTGDGNGKVFIDFDNTPVIYNFAFCCSFAGSLSVTVNDAMVSEDGIVAITGQITGANINLVPVPEPTSIILMASGLAGAAAAARNRMRIKKRRRRSLRM